MEIINRVKKADDVTLDDLEIDLSNAGGDNNEEGNTDVDVPDIGGEESGEEDGIDGTGEEDNSVEDDILSGDLQSPVPESNPVEEEQYNVDRAESKLTLASLNVMVTDLTIQIKKLENENYTLHERLAELSQDFYEKVLQKIPDFNSVELPYGSEDPHTLIPYISSAIDKTLMRLFYDVPEYNFTKFSVLNRDDNNKVQDGLINLDVSFSQESRWKAISFSLELWIVDGFLQIPQWFIYKNRMVKLTKEGIHSIEEVSYRENKGITPSQDPYEHTTWYNQQSGKMNPVLKPEDNLPPSTHYMNNRSWKNNKGW